MLEEREEGDEGDEGDEEVMAMCLRETVLWESRNSVLRPKVVVVLAGMGIWDWEGGEKMNAVVVSIRSGNKNEEATFRRLSAVFPSHSVGPSKQANNPLNRR